MNDKPQPEESTEFGLEHLRGCRDAAKIALELTAEFFPDDLGKIKVAEVEYSLILFRLTVLEERQAG